MVGATRVSERVCGPGNDSNIDTISMRLEDKLVEQLLIRE